MSRILEISKKVKARCPWVWVAVESLYESMVLYHNNPKMRAEHGSAGRKRVEELYDNRVVTQAWVEYYKTLFN